MIVALTTTEMWTALFVVGIVASFITVFLILASASAKRQAPEHAELVPVNLSHSIREAASARAAQAALRRSGHSLTNVRAVAPTGQTPIVQNDLHHGSEVAKEASAILVHFAEHDPKRIAEVIKQWIQVDEKNARKFLG